MKMKCVICRYMKERIAIKRDIMLRDSCWCAPCELCALSAAGHQVRRGNTVNQGSQSTCGLENDTVMNFIPIPIPTELKVDKVNIMLIKS